jgi:hypothetical protein
MSCEEEDIPEIVDAKTNDATTKRVMEDWSLGPVDASYDNTSNKPFWVAIAKVWNVEESQARRQKCANCEYFNNTPEMAQAMEAIPLNDFDVEGGGRGYCHKFDFICHNLRTCQAWERKDYEMEED